MTNLQKWWWENKNQSYWQIKRDNLKKLDYASSVLRSLLSGEAAKDIIYL